MIGTALMIALCAAAWSVGHSAYEAGVRNASPARRLPVTEVWFAKSAAAIAAATWMGIVLAELGAFDGWTLALLLGLTGAALSLLARRSGALRRRGRSGTLSLGLLVLVVVGALSFHPPFDVRLQARDPGTYYLTGQRLADTGALVSEDPVVAALSPQQRNALFPPTSRPTSRFLGFYLSDPGEALVIPQALPGLPVWIALGAEIAGASGARLATPALALLAVLGVTFLARGCFGSVPGFVAGLLLAFNFVQAWFARYVAAEILVQALLMLGLYALLQFRRHDDAFFGLLAAFGLGLTWFTKAELGVLAVPLALLLLADAARGRITRRALVTLWLPLGLLGAHGLAHAVGWTWPYTSDLLLQFEVPPRTFAVVGAAGLTAYGFVVAAVALGRRRWIGSGPPSATGTWRRADVLIRSSITVALLAGVVYGVWWRPAEFAQRLAAGRINDSWNAHVVQDLGTAVSAAVLVLAFLGALVMIWDRGVSKGARTVIALLALVALVPLWRRQINPQLLWAYRRWIPATIPWTVVMGALGWFALCAQVPAAVGRGASRFPKSPARIAWRHAIQAAIMLAGVALAAAVIVQQAPLAIRYAAHVELPGSAAALGELDRLFERDGLILFEPRTRRGLVPFEAALAFDRQREVVRIARVSTPRQVIEEVVRQSAARGRPVYLVTTGWLDWPETIGAKPVEDFEFHSQRLEERATYLQIADGRRPELPEGTSALHVYANVYELQPGSALAPLSGELDVGSWDDLYLDGPTLYESERDPSGRTFRWTFPTAEFRLHGLDASATSLLVVLEDDGPLVGEERFFELALDGVSLGRHAIRPGWLEYRFAIPPEWTPGDRPPRLEVASEGFRPVDLGRGDDRRLLGVKVDLIRWSSEPPARGGEAGDR